MFLVSGDRNELLLVIAERHGAASLRELCFSQRAPLASADGFCCAVTRMGRRDSKAVSLIVQRHRVTLPFKPLAAESADGGEAGGHSAARVDLGSGDLAGSRQPQVAPAPQETFRPH